MYVRDFMIISKNTSISELTLERIFSTILIDTLCVYLNQDREEWVSIEMCVQYLESSKHWPHCGGDIGWLV